MADTNQSHQLPITPGEVKLGRTLPSLLDEACDRHPHNRALNQRREQSWLSLSSQAFRAASEEVALGLLNLGLTKGDRVGLFMHSDVNFCLADIGCLMAGLVDVPIDLDEATATIEFILQHTESKALVISDANLLRQIAPQLANLTHLQSVIVAETDANELPQFPSLPQRLQVLSLADIRARGRTLISEDTRQRLRAAIAPTDLATIIYALGSAEHLGINLDELQSVQQANTQPDSWQKLGQNGSVCEMPRGIALSHENISANILAAFSSHPHLKPGRPEVVLSFLPLTHIFARAFLYGHLNYGHSVYFSPAERVATDLKDVQPTLFTTVPRLLEKAYERILKAGRQQRGWSKRIFNWALDLAHRYELGHSPRGWYGLQLWIARWLVFAKWRAAFGGKLRYLICGGAALSPTIANVLSAASIPVLQGYGLTETSSVVCYNRDRWNRAGTVGVPIPGVDLQLAEDGEILVRSPYVMQGYYKDAAATQAAIDAGGWFHTGDLGELTPEGFLKIVGYKKNLFKLSTGRYVSPQPFERQLCQSPFVEWAIVVGAQRKFCSVLIVPHLETLSRWARERGLDCATERWLHQPQVKALYQALVDEANQCLPYGSRAKRFHLVDVTLAIAGENSELDVQQHRHSSEALTTAIEAIYAETEGQLPLHLFIPFSYLHLSYLHQLIAIRPH